MLTDLTKLTTEELNEYMLHGSEGRMEMVEFDKEKFKTVAEQYRENFGFVERVEEMLVDLFLMYEDVEATKEFWFDFVPGEECSLRIISNHPIPPHYTLSSEFIGKVKEFGFCRITHFHRDRDGNQYENGKLITR